MSFPSLRNFNSIKASKSLPNYPSYVEAVNSYRGEVTNFKKESYHCPQLLESYVSKLLDE